MKSLTTTSSFLALLALTSTCLALPAANKQDLPANEQDRDQRQLALFSIVSFENDDCVAVSGTTATGNMGKCYTSTECTSRGGTARGNCASGFGVCCVVTLAACGGTVSLNSTYIANAGFDVTSTTGITSLTGTCTYTINYVSTDICQLRLDFQTFVLSAAANAAAAATDSFTVTGPTGANPPVISGVNTGLHMYVETSKSTTTTTIAVAFGTATTSRRWNVRVDQIECSNTLKAPSGCTQYFTANSGTATSYNWVTTSGRELSNQRMTICVRAGTNNCNIQWSKSTSTSFIVGVITAEAATGNCAIAAVYIPRAIVGPSTVWGGEVCQGTFSSANAAIVSGTITQEAPFIITHKSVTPAAAATMATGFSLNYAQQGC